MKKFPLFPSFDYTIQEVNTKFIKNSFGRSNLSITFTKEDYEIADRFNVTQELERIRQIKKSKSIK